MIGIIYLEIINNINNPLLSIICKLREVIYQLKNIVKQNRNYKYESQDNYC